MAVADGKEESASAPAEPRPAPALDRHERMPVGVVVERRKAANPWDDFIWQAVAVIPGAAATPPWTVLRSDGPATQFFAGTGEIELHPRETLLYRANLDAPRPSVYVVLERKDGAAPGVALRHVTVSPGDAEAFMDDMHLVDPVPMPDLVAAWMAEYIAAFHVEQTFRKRKRKPHDPRKGFGFGSGSIDYGPSTE